MLFKVTITLAGGVSYLAQKSEKLVVVAVLILYINTYVYLKKIKIVKYNLLLPLLKLYLIYIIFIHYISNV